MAICGVREGFKNLSHGKIPLRGYPPLPPRGIFERFPKFSLNIFYTLASFASVHIFCSEEPEMQFRSGDLVKVHCAQPPSSNLGNQ